MKSKDQQLLEEAYQGVLKEEQAKKADREYIDKLKARGKKWLEDNIAMEKKLLTSKEPEYVLYRKGMRKISDNEESSYVSYIKAMEKALKEINHK